ncbi:MAG: hypothetical protein IKF72_10280 [Kiritimatiellae bacterium]|nr:hypothetical protein [Kiritimatiellia bacterium]
MKKLMRNFVTGVALAIAAAASGAGFTLYNVVPFSPGSESVAAADAKEYRERTGNDLVLYSLTLHPEGRPAIEKVRRYVESFHSFKAALDGSDVRAGVLVQAILGHWPRVDKDIEDWTRTVNIKGEKVRFCPDDPGFAQYITDTFTLLAREKPAFILTDDDVRAYSHEAECFCPRHVAEFNGRRGTEFSECELRERVRNARQDDPDYTTFLAVQRDMMERLAKRMRVAIDAVDPAIPAGICVANEETFLAAPLARAMAARGQRPVMRASTGCYMERYGSRFAPIVFRMLGFAERYRDSGIDLLDEADTCPHNLWSKSARSFFTHLAVASFAGFSGAKTWYVNGHKGKNAVSRAYTDVLAGRMGCLDALADAAADGEFAGVAVPCFSRFPKWHLGGNHGEMYVESRTFAETVLLPFGVPFRAERDFSSDGVYLVSRSDEVERFTDDELNQVFSHKVLVTGSAAVALAKRGRQDLIGLSADRRDFRFNRERDVETGTDFAAAPSDRMPFFSGLASGVETLTQLGFSPYTGSPAFEVAAPGAVLYRNALGGTVVTCAYHGGMTDLHQHSEARKAFVMNVLDRLNGAALPYVCGNDQDVLTLVRTRKGGGAAVLAANLNSEPIRALKVRVPSGDGEASVLAADGTWRKVQCVRDGEWLTVPVALGFYETAAVRFGRAED